MADTTTVKRLLNSFGFVRGKPSGMVTDPPVSLQPEMTVRNAWGVSNQSTEEEGGGYYNMAGMEKWVNFPAGADKRGEHFLEERDQMVVFLEVNGKSEIGYWSTQTLEYIKVIDDNDIEGCDLNFGKREWIPIVSKNMLNGTCNEIHLYWANGGTYKTLNFDRPCVPIDCSEINLFNCKCFPVPTATTTKKGGFDLEAGAYQYFAQGEDKDKNTTNFFQISNPLYVGSKNNRAGDISEQAVNIVVQNLDPDYEYINLAVIKTIGGTPSAYVIAKLPYSPKGVTFYHRSKSQFLYDLTIEEVLVKNPGYIRGFDLYQYDRVLYLFNTKPIRELDMQARIMDSVKAKYRVGRVPMRYAHQFSGNQREGVYSYSANYNFCDGRKSRAFHFLGTGIMPTSGGNCVDCEDDNYSSNGTATQINGKPYDNPITKGNDEYTPFTETKLDNLNNSDFDLPDDDQFVPEETGSGNECACWAFEQAALAGAGNRQAFAALYFAFKDLCESGCVGPESEGATGDGEVLPRTDATNDNSGCNCFDSDDMTNVRAIYEGQLGINADPGVTDATLQAWWSSQSGQVYSGTPCGPCEGGGQMPVIEDGASDPRFKKLEDIDLTNGFKPTTQEITDSVGQGNEGNNSDTTKTVHSGSSESSATSTRASITMRDCEPTIIYADEECCVIKEIIPCIDDEGLATVYVSCEKYPDEERCCSEGKTYGAYAGKNIQYFKMPSLAEQPHFISYHDGVPSAEHRDNHEYNNSFARFIWMEFSGIPMPDDDELDVPLCPINPVTINWELRDPVNDTVLASGILLPTFEGETLGETMLFPTHGTSSPEYLDRWINNNGSHRTNLTPTIPAYVFFSPDTAFDRPSLQADYMRNALNLTGRGWRHELYAEGADPDSSYVGKKNRKGARSSMNLNKWEVVNGNDIRCVVAASYVPANSVLDKADEFSKSLCNLNRPSCVYVETDGDRIPMVDTSFDRDIETHSKPLTGAAQYVSLNRFIPNAYGGVTDNVYFPIWQVSSEDIGEDGKATVLVRTGDTFINYWSIKRPSYVTNHVAPHPRGIKPNFEYGGGITLPWPFESLLRRLFNSISGDCNCGTIPEGGNAARDPRASNAENGSGTTDRWFPQVQTQLLSFPVESRVNLGFQGSGDDPATSTYRDLNGQIFDSTFEGGGDGAYEHSWMDRYFAKMCENPKWKCLLRTFVNILFTFGIGVGLIIKGLLILTHALTGTEVGVVITVMSIVAAGMGILLMLVGIIWIIAWSNTDLDNRFIDSLLTITDCFPDKRAKRNGDGDAEMKDSRVQGFEDNHYEYNYDFSLVNKIEAVLGLPAGFDPCYCENDTSYPIWHSNPQNPESKKDAYRNFKTNGYFGIPTHHGRPQRMVNISNVVYLLTTDARFQLSLGNVAAANPYLETSGRFLIQAQLILGFLQEGEGGTRDPNACELTKWGDVVIDVEARQINLFNSNGYQPIADGMSLFLDKYMPFEAGDDVVRDERAIDGVGYSIGVDNAREILFVTKRDFRMKGGAKEDRSWTLSFNMKTQSLIGHEFFTPLGYSWDRFKMFSLDNGTMWQHNKVGEFSTVYGKPVPMIIDFVITDPQTLDNFKWRNSTVYAEFDEWDGNGFIPKKDIFFNEIGAYNTFQSSGSLPVVQKEKLEYPDNSSQDPTNIHVSNIHRAWRFNGLIDKVDTRGKRLFTTWQEEFLTDFKKDVLGEKTVSNRLIDNYLVVRLIFFSEDPKIRVLLKRVITEVNLEQL